MEIVIKLVFNINHILTNYCKRFHCNYTLQLVILMYINNSIFVFNSIENVQKINYDSCFLLKISLSIVNTNQHYSNLTTRPGDTRIVLWENGLLL